MFADWLQRIFWRERLSRILSLSLLTSTLVFAQAIAGPIYSAEAATTATYSASFTGGTNASSSAKAGWGTFLSSLTESYYAIEIVSSNGNSISVSDYTKVNEIASRLRNWSSNTATTNWTIGSRVVTIGSCGGGVELSIGGTSSNCQCPTSGVYTVRPQIGDGNPNWGGANGSTCNGPTQTLQVRFIANLITNGEFTDGTNSWNSQNGWQACSGGGGGNLPCVDSGNSRLIGGYTGSDITQTVTGLNPTSVSSFDFNINLATNSGGFSDLWYVGVNFRNASNEAVASLRYPAVSGYASAVHGFTTYNLNLPSSTANFADIRSAVITFYGRDTGWAGNYGPSVEYMQLSAFSSSPSSTSALTAPTSLSASATSNTLKSFSTSWTNSANASSHTVKIYANDGSTLLQTIANATSPLTVNATNFSSIADGTTYKISVIAVGSGNYTNSTEASQVSVTTNRAALTPIFGSPSFSSGTWTIPVTNYDANYTWTFSVSGGSYSAATASGSTRNVTVTPPSGTAVTLTANTSRSGYVNGTATTSSYYPGCNPTQSQLSGYTVIKFTSVTTCAWGIASNVSAAEILVVGGGGGGGGMYWSGGGGGGGVLHASSQTITANDFVVVTVGAGGAGGTTTAASSRGSNGGNSSINLTVSGSRTTYTANGGGGGGGYGWGAGSSTVATGLTGGSSGGHGEMPSGTGLVSSTAATQSSSGSFTGYANSSGSMYGAASQAGSGGGGAGGAGGNVTTYRGPGVGGAGRSFTLESASGVFYAGGGGGASITGAAGGSGGGGRGASSNGSPTAGTDGLGGGGGGAQNNTAGGAGGSGVVIVKYANPPRSITYSLNSGSGTTPTQAPVSDGASFNLASTSGLSKSGFYLSGWSDGSTTYQPGASYTVGASDISLVAQWTAVANPVIATQPQALSKTLSQSATFSVAATVSDGGTLSYQWKKNGSAISSATSATYTINSIVSGDAAAYSVEVTNTKSNGSVSVTSNSVNLTLVGAPEAPRNVTLSTNDSNGSALSAGSLRLYWTAPASDGGSAVTGYEYRFSLASEDSWSSWTSTSDTGTVLSGLGNSRSYKAQVRAKNTYGVSASASTTANVLTTGSVSTTTTSPSITSIVADTSLGGRLTVNFTAPSVSGDQNVITSYQYSTDNGSSWKTATWTAGTSSFVMTSPSNSTNALTNGTSYTVLLRAVNAAGPGTSSAGVAATPSKAPGAPTSLSLALPGSNVSGTITATFTAPTDTGGLTLSYEYRIKLSSSSTWGSWTSGGSSSPISITGITNGQTYDVQVRSKNASGESAESNTATLNTVLATGPTITTQPTNKTLTVDQTTGTTLTVAATGTSDETISYQWYKNGSAISGATSATLTITNKAVTGDAGTYYAIVTASKSGTSANVSAKIDAMGPSNSICNAPNNQTFYYANRFYAGTADTIREFQIQMASGTNASVLAASKIRFYKSTSATGSGTFYNTWSGPYPQPNESAQVVGTDFTYVSTSNNIATFRGTAALPEFGHYWWAFINNSTTSVNFCNSNSTETYTNGWYLYKEGTSWIWFGSFRQNIDKGKFAWYTHPNIRIFTSTTTTTSTSTTQSNSVTVTVNPVPTITTSTVPGATKGSAYSTTLANSGGTGPFTWTLVNGSSLPQGLSLSTSGVISGTPTATEASSASSTSSSSAGALKNGNFSASFANTASDGWWRAATRGGQTVINTVGKTLQFSFGSPACSTQSTVAMSEVRQQVTVASAGTVTFKVKVVNDIWNRIGFAYSNPCYDPYQVTMTRSGVAATGKPTSVDTGRRIPNATTHQYAQEHEVTLTFETTQANEVVTISLFGLDAGYWAGNYGPVFKDARLETPGGSSGASSSSGTTTFTVEITDANGIKSTKTLTFAVASNISITTKTLGSANRGSSYTQALVATGGSGSLTWTVSNGTLPTGLTLNSSGSISGTVGTTAASSTFTVSVTDANNAVVTQTYTLNVLSGVPAAPSSLTVGTVASATLPLTWTAPTDNGGSAITGYVVSYSSGKGAGDDGEEGEEDKGSVLVNATGLTFPYSLTGLKNGRSYTVTVAAKNANATSVASNSVSAVPAKAAGAPQQLSMVLANGGITFRWKKPQDSGGLKIASYAVQCRNTANADTEANWKAITNRQDTDSNGQISLVLDATSTEITVTQGQSYVCRVRANSAIGGVSYTGAWATASSALVFSTVPTSPNITIVDTTTASTKISVTFTQSSSDGGSQITSYIATATKSQSNSDDDEGNKRSCNVNRPNSGWGAGAQTCQITGIPKKGAFSVEVVAVNAVGKSVADTETVTIVGNTQILTYPDNSNNPGYTYNKVVTDADFPINVKSNSGLKLKYSIDNNDICTITGKGLIKVKKVGSCRITITQSGKADDDDDDDSNNKTDSDWEPITGTSQFVDVNIVGSTPSNPSWTSVAPGSSKLTATWKAPTGKNNQVTSYKLEWTTDTNAVTWSASDSLTVASNVLTSDITGLTNGTAYRVRVTAINSGASSSAILMPGSFTPASAPSKPTLGSILSYPDTSTVTVNWSAPASNGAAITGYTATATATGQTTLTCSTGGSATSCSITGVKNKVTYSITLTARNSIGSSEASDPSSVLVSGVSQTITIQSSKVPAATGWSVGDPDLQLEPSIDSGLPLQYSVQSSSICTVSTGGLVHFVSDGTCRVYIDQDGTNSATGGGSATKYSAASQYGPIELVISPAKPSAPTLTSVANSANGLVITWTAPSKGGGTMTYTVTGAASGKSNETCSTTALTCTIQVASKGTRYSFTAVANNGIDTSTASTAMFGTWLVVPSAPNTSSTPSAPSTTDGKALNIYWTKSTDNGGILILAYTVTAANATYGNKTCVVTRTSTRDETGYSCTISGLRAGATYAITVTARNVIGNSSDLSIGSLTPGLTQTISLGENTSTSISKTFGDADFALNATIDSGNTPSFTTSSSACSVSSTGLVHILTVGSCVVTVSHPGATDSADSQYKAATSVTITITIANGTPSKATITQVSPTNSGLIVRFTAPSSTGGSTLSYVVRAVNGGTTVNCSAGGSDTCTVTGLVNGTEYQVTVIATNAGSNSSTSDAVSGIPYSNSRAPMPLTANGGIRQAELTWQQPAQYDGSLYRYKLLYRIAGSGSAFTELEVETSTVTSTISGLANNTRYEFQARAVVIDNSNVTALGDLTSSVFATTYALPGSPLNPASTSTYVTASGTSTAAVSWQPPTSNGGSAIIDYTVTASGGPSAGPCTTSSLTCNITGLTPGVSYTFSVTARTSVGTGSAGTIAHTTIAPASAPGSVALTLGSDSGTVTVNWSAPSSNGGTPITSYVVTVYTEAGTAQSFGCTVSAPSTSCVITGLPYKTSYKIAVAAVTGAGTGTYSAFTSPFTLSKDQNITFAEINPQGFNVKTLTLEATTDSGLPITYTSGDATICSISGSTLTFQKIGNCSVTASQAGDSTYNAAGSVTRSFVIQAIDPEAVTLLQVAPGASKLTVSWSTATQLGGSTLKHYVVSWAKQTDFSDEQTLTTNSNTNVEITGLDAGAAYIVRIAVVTNDGSNPSEWSNRLSAKTFGAPAATDKPTVSTSAAGVVTVTWTNVSSANAGGTPITGYRVDAVVSSTSASTTFFCTAAASTCDVSGLSGSTYYKFKVTAINAVGSTESVLSDEIRPGQSQTITFENISTSHLAGNIKLAATTSSGLPISYSVVSQSPTNAESATWGSGRNVCVVDTAGNLTVDVGGTCVIAANQDGTDNGTETSYLPATEVRATITVAIDKPSLIAELTLTAGNQKIEATWTAPDVDGGAPITDYILTWFVKGNRHVDLTVGGTTAVTSSDGSYGRVVLAASSFTSTTMLREITGLTNGVTYSVRVQAKNSAGLGPEQ